MYAVIKTGGKQYKVAVGDEIFVEKLGSEVGETVTFDEVLAVGDDNGIKAGADVAAKVTGEVVKQGKNKKIVVLKYKGLQKKEWPQTALYKSTYYGHRLIKAERNDHRQSRQGSVS